MNVRVICSLLITLSLALLSTASTWAQPAPLPMLTEIGKQLSLAAAADEAPEAVATIQNDGWAVVDRITGPETLVVRNANGERFRVWHVGVIGPTATQDGGEWYRRATAIHAEILPVGTKVWLENQPGSEGATRGQWVYRHVYRERMPDEPIGGELLRSGMTWVYPHATHPFVTLYADEQAEAISKRAGLWAETQSSTVFLPEGATYGGFPVNPQIIPALQALQADPVGKEVLSSVNEFPVEIGISTLPHGVLGVHVFRLYTIQLSEDIMDAPPESIAAVLAHELTHAKQMIDAGIKDSDLGCYDMEVQAFEVTAKYWSDLYGANGKRQSTHWLDDTLNANLRDFNNRRIAQNVRRAYGHECGAAFLDGAIDETNPQ
jgi:endonuclease YncB( thermonuclease family)